MFVWFFFSGWIIVFCFHSLAFGVPEPSRNLRKTAKTENKFNGYWCLHQKYSGSGQLFCSWRFLKIFFFEISSIKFSFRIINWFFSLFGAWHQKKDSKSKKWVWKQKKGHARLKSATTKIFAPKVRPHWGAFEKVVLTWPLTPWSLTSGLFFAQKSTKYRKK